MLIQQHNKPFTSGKGKGDRAFQHLDEAEAHGNSSKTTRIRSVWQKGKDVEIVIHRHNLTEEEAILVESVLIDLMPYVEHDSQNNTNLVKGHGSGRYGTKSAIELNHQYAAEEAELKFPVALIKINRKWKEHFETKGHPTQQDIYEMVRGSWVINPNRHPDVHHAAAVAFGLIRGIYKIDSWYEKDQHNRHTFNGHPAQDLSHLIGKHVNHLFSKGAQAPVRWLCPQTYDENDENKPC